MREPFSWFSFIFSKRRRDDESVCVFAAGVSGWLPLHHIKPVSLFRMAGKPSLRQQRLPTCRGCKPGLLHSSQSSQRVQTSGLCISSSISQSERVPYLSKAFPVESIFSDDIFGGLVYISEGISGVVYFTINNEQEDCNHIEDTGVESVKGMSMFDSP